MGKENEIELIEKYLNNELNDSEGQSIEKLIEEDEELAREFQRRQTAHLSLDHMIAKNLKEQLQELEEKDKIVSIRKNRSRRIFLYSAAASILFLISVFFFLFPKGAMNNTELALSLYESPEAGFRGNTSDISEEAFNRGITAFGNKDFDQAIRDFEAIPEDSPYYIQGRYYLGHSLFAQGAYAKAIDAFSLVKQANDPRYTEAAEWYELLSCLANGNNCTDLINNIVEDENHAYFSQTKKINKKLK